MSLQPLDSTAEIVEAYKLALTESRRWYAPPLQQHTNGLLVANACRRLVLVYSSRSTLALRAEGMGLPELRKELEDEEEVLFGFLRFRRRGIVLQYTNPDCSRVVKGLKLEKSEADVHFIARAQVHLQTILNFFRDHDFVLETSTPKDITLDNIARLTNSTSTSTINSNKKSKRLTDIMEESPIIIAQEEEDLLEDGASSPTSSEANSTTSHTKRTSTEDPTPPTTEGSPSKPSSPPTILAPPKNKHLLKPLGTSEGSLASPPLTPRSPLPPSPLRRTPSPSETTNRTASDYQGDSLTSPTPPPETSQQTRPNTNRSVPVNLPPTPPTPPEKLRLLKALEIRRQKLSGKAIVVVPKVIQSPKPQPVKLAEVAAVVTVVSGNLVNKNLNNHRARIDEAKRAAMEEHRQHIVALEQAGRDLLNGWINFQSSTSLVYPPPSIFS